jgi:pimeloyl-ACP methyl ester carboxylesterase
MNLLEQDLTANGVRLHVYRTGAQKPPLVFAHGITDNGLCFTPIAETLSATFEIILYDARGHGKSAPSLPNTTSIDRAHDLGGIIDALELKRPRLIGHSMGAVTVALYAGLYPQVPGCIILEDPPPFEMMARMGEETRKGPPPWLSIAAANKQKSIQELIQMNRDENPTWPGTASLGAIQATGEPDNIRGCRISETDRVQDHLPNPDPHCRSKTGRPPAGGFGRTTCSRSAACLACQHSQCRA